MNLQANSNINKRSNISSLNLNPPVPDPIIVHPGVVVVMLQLLPCIEVISNESVGNFEFDLNFGKIFRSKLIHCHIYS